MILPCARYLHHNAVICARRRCGYRSRRHLCCWCPIFLRLDRGWRRSRSSVMPGIARSGSRELLLSMIGEWHVERRTGVPVRAIRSPGPCESRLIPPKWRQFRGQPSNRGNIKGLLSASSASAHLGRRELAKVLAKRAPSPCFVARPISFRLGNRVAMRLHRSCIAFVSKPSVV
jgi:hypothetical protein